MKKILFMLIGALAFSCGGGGGGGGEGDTLEDGWAFFEQGRFSEARDVFQSLVSTEGAAANEGVGWCNLRLDNLTQADTDFSGAGNRTDANAGWAFVKWANEEYSESISKASAVLTSNATYVFSHDNSVTSHDLVLHQAFSYFHLGDFTNCVSRIQVLDAAFNPNLGDPDIEEILLTKLELLAAQFA